jgi:hypothetical protein
MEHLDEGTIHAWLDGELPPAEAAALEDHAKRCGACGHMVSEARGLTAASTRILKSLDEVPSRVVPLGVEALRHRAPVPRAGRVEPASNVQRRAKRVWFRRPQVAAAAALLLVAVGTWRVAREQPSATVADFAAPVVQPEAPTAGTLLDSGALSGATAAKNEVAQGAPASAAVGAAQAKKAPSATALAANPRAEARPAENVPAQGAASASADVGPGRARQAAPQVMADAVAERKTTGDSSGRAQPTQSVGFRSRTDTVPRAVAPDSLSRRMTLEEVTVTGASQSTKPMPVNPAMVDSVASGEARRLAGEREAALSSTRDSAANPPNRAAGAPALANRAPIPVPSAVTQAAGCYHLAKLQSTEPSLPARIRLLSTIARQEPLVWYQAQGYPEGATPSQWVWRVVPESGVQLSRVDDGRRVLTVMITGSPAVTADRVACP